MANKHIRNAHPSWAAKFIRKERLRQNITQEELSRRSGVRPGNLRLIEWECNSPRYATMEKLINTLGYELTVTTTAGADYLMRQVEAEDAAQSKRQYEKRTEHEQRETHDVLVVLETRAKRLGMSLQQACEEAGVAYSTVTRWRTGFSSPTIRSISRIDAALSEVEGNDETCEQIEWLEQLCAK